MAEPIDGQPPEPAGHAGEDHLSIGEHAEAFAPRDPEIPPLPDDATPEEKDLHWYTHVYQGDNMKQLTFRAVAMGAVIGMLMSISNLYTTLEVGWQFGVAITACVMSYVTWNFFRLVSGNKLSQMSILENNCMQSTASAAGYSTGSTIATAFGALLILDPNHLHQPWYIVASFTLVTAAMGVFLAIPMKRQMINQEKLPFPSGIAAATTLRSLYSEGREAVRQAYSLVIALFASAIGGVLTTAKGTFVALDNFFAWVQAHMFRINLPDIFPEKGFFRPGGMTLSAFGIETSALLIAAGMIVGMRVSLSMLAASALLYFFLTPYLLSVDAAHAGIAGYVPSYVLAHGATAVNPLKWSVWGGASVMVFSSLMSLALQWPTIVRSFTSLKKKTTSGDTPTTDEETQRKMAEIEVPTSWLVIGMIPITILMLVVQAMAFQISVGAGLVAVGMSFVLALVACRATGETDTTPIGAMGKIMQLLFAAISPNNVMHNLMSAGIAANAASSSADLLTDLKSGYLLGANPRKQFIAQFVGIFFGTLAIVPAWYLMCPNVQALQKFPLPATAIWVAVAKLLSLGLSSLSDSAKIAAVIGAIIGCTLPVLEKLFPRARPYLPSAMGLGLGWVVYFSNALAFVIGAVLTWGWSKINEKSCESYNVPIASGLIAGESMMKAFLAMLATAIGLYYRHH